MCLRWSNQDGRYLASGSDDNVILIWEQDTSADGWHSTTFGCAEANLENWKAVKRLAGHESDVSGLAWSHDNSYLASCGLDSNVFIWHGRTFDRHRGFVKGISFDPAGKYLATQSDDRTVKIWQTSDWTVTADITEPFSKSPNATFFQRLSWSPEGSHIATANAMNGPVPVSAVIGRGDWDSEISLVGHDAAIEVAHFNPILFYAKEEDPSYTGPRTLMSVVALGSQDRSVSFWEKLLTKFGYKKKTTILAENPEQLALEEEFAVRSKNISSKRIMDLMGSEAPPTITADTPKSTSASTPAPSETSPLKQQTATTPTATQAQSDNTSLVPENPPPTSFESKTTPIPDSSSHTITSGCRDQPETPLQQKVTITKSGKKRVQPTFLRGLSVPSAQPSNGDQRKVETKQSTPNEKFSARVDLIEFTRRYGI
ncbi:uncharacterized protein VTP21DRAFT_7239 [Calcarisporiella thermophila]|uniref:uncharacterized protein n=1 Tax=Calcarisporiella thermophila TaxID=911321 RepID=UPI00374214C3